MNTEDDWDGCLLQAACNMNAEDDWDGCLLQAACNMNTEDDAELALKISNALTQALLEHRQSALRAVVLFAFVYLIVFS